MSFADFISEYGLFLAYILVAAAALAALILPFINALNDPKSLVKIFIGLGILLAVFFIGYLVSGNEVTEAYITHNLTSAGASKLVGGALITMYILVALALVGIVISEVSKVIK